MGGGIRRRGFCEVILGRVESNLVSVLCLDGRTTRDCHEHHHRTVGGRMSRVGFGNGSRQPRERLEGLDTVVACFASQSDGETQEE